MTFLPIPGRHPTFHVTGLISRGIDTIVRSINLLFIVAISFLSMENSPLILQKKKETEKKEASRQRTRARVLPTRGDSLAGSQSRVRVSTCT